ncbi:MAG: PIG-L family deacetylase [Bacteroidales bacterium]|nr:PIG-L family deacetylase [Bacteroidales bacterium]
MVIAPHLDDEVLGCGGVIAKHVEIGHSIHVCFIAHRVYNHQYDEKKMAIEKEHAKKASHILGYDDMIYLDLPDERLDSCIQDIIIPLEECFENIQPDIVFSPFFQDNNQDHRAVARAVQVVLRPASTRSVKKWMMYETPSSTEQSPNIGLSFNPTVYYDIESTLAVKLKALNCYETEMRKFPHPRSSEGIKALAMKRGMEAGLCFAESFILVRERK